MSDVNRYYAPGLDCMWRDPSIAPRECTPMVLASDYDLLQAERDELRAQVEAMHKDAERYRWLRDSARIIGDYIDSHEHNFCVCTADGSDVMWFEQLDKSIDAAMQAKP